VTDVLPMTIYCAVMSITPGPNNMMLTASGANFGFARTLPQIVAWPPAQLGLQVAGALYLAWLAWKLSGARVGAAMARAPLSFSEGLLFQVMNPKGWVKALTLGSAFMPPALAPLPAAMLVSAVGLVAALPCISAWALFGVSIRRFLCEPAHQRAFNLAMSATLLVLALMFLR
jgi:threonine/homoserine/homoserine lactone efflux protein